MMLGLILRMHFKYHCSSNHVCGLQAIKKDLPDWDACMWRNVILRLSDEALGLHKPGCKARSTPHSPPVATSRCVHVKHESNDRIAQHLLQAMLYLPRGLRERWLRGMRPHVDLWDVELTWVDWEHVMGCLHRIQNAPVRIPALLNIFCTVLIT